VKLKTPFHQAYSLLILKEGAQTYSSTFIFELNTFLICRAEENQKREMNKAE